jgi:hypothetical protein
LVADSASNFAGSARYAAELGYDVTVVKDATADYSDEHMHAAFDVKASITAAATFDHSASPDNVTCWYIITLQ